VGGGKGYYELKDGNSFFFHRNRMVNLHLKGLRARLRLFTAMNKLKPIPRINIQPHNGGSTSNNVVASAVAEVKYKPNLKTLILNGLVEENPNSGRRYPTLKKSISR